MTRLELKKELISSVINELCQRIKSETTMIESARETANSDTKSSAGDKYETTRAMMHLEQEKYSRQLSDTLELKKRAESVIVDQEYESIQSGAVAITSLGNFFIAISAEDIEIDDDEYTPISLASPLGESLKGKKNGETFQFRNQKISIKSVF